MSERNDSHASEDVERALSESLFELQRTERELRHSEKQLRDFVENAAVALHRVGPDGTILWANRAELELLGYTADEYVGRSIADFHADQEVIRNILERLTRRETLHDHEAQLRAKDGSIKHVLISSNVYTRDGEFVHTRCFTRDITGRRRAEDALRQSERQIKLITDALPSLVAYVDTDQRYTFVNAAYERWFGRTAAEHIGRRVGDFLDDEAFEKVRPHIERALSGVPVTYEAELSFPDGRARAIEATYVPQREDGGEVLGFVAFVADVTDRKSFERFKADAALRAQRLLKITTAIADAVVSDEVFEAVVDHVAEAVNASSAGLWLVGEDGKNAHLARGLGYSDAARRTIEAIPMDFAEASPVLDCLRSGAPVWLASQGELLERYPHLQGIASAGRSYRISCLPMVAHGRTFGALGLTIEDGNEHTESECAFLVLVARYASQALERLRLFEQERRSRAAADVAAARAEHLYRFAQSVVAASHVEQVFEAALDTIEATLETNRASILTYGGDTSMRFRAFRNLSLDYRVAVEGHSPWARDEAAPKAVLVTDVTRDETMAEYLPLFCQEGIGAVAFIPLATGGRLLGKFMVYYARPHVWAPHEIETASAIANHLASVIARFAAISELEDSVQQNELFAGVLAHDLRTPLGAIMMAAQMMLMDTEGERSAVETRGKPLSRILSSGQRMRRLIDQLLDFTRARAGGGIDIHRRPTNLAALCTQSISELELAYPAWTMSLETEGDVSGSWDPDRLLQVVSNLVSNAGQHGRRDTGIVVRLDGTQRETVCLSVHNMGAIPDTLVPHLFDPFRGTNHRRSASGGLGLGLFIVKEIVVAHGGHVSAASSEEMGTTFSMRLPRGA